MTDAPAPSVSSNSAIPPSTPGEDEDARLAEFGYSQKLDRSVGSLASFAIGFATISATTAVFTGFGAGYIQAGGPFVWTLLLAGAVFAMVLSVPLAMISASRPGTAADSAVRVIPLVGIGLPSFWVLRAGDKITATSEIQDLPLLGLRQSQGPCARLHQADAL